MPFSWPVGGVALLLAQAIAAAVVQAQAPAPPAERAETAFLEAARKYAIELPQDGGKLDLNEKSLLNWTNPIRQQERGAIFAWMHEGRPLAIGSFFTYEYDNKVYTKHEFHSLATVPLDARFNDTPAWTPQKQGLEWRTFEGGAQPAAARTARTLQMRQLARRFRAELIDPQGEKTALRLVSRPLLEYAAARSGVLDGAMFSFVVATDPEALLLVEAVETGPDGKASAGFRYAFARFHYWQLAAYEGDTKRWEAPLDKAHELNYLGDRENMGKIYNSFHPHRKGEE